MGLATYGDGNATSLIICDECRSSVTTLAGAMSTEAFGTRAPEERCSALLGHASLVRAHAFASGWSVDDAGVCRCARCATSVRLKTLDARC